MEMIVAAACCSILVSILLKYLKAKGFDVFQIIAWNYLSASLLCFYWFKTDITHISLNNTPWWLILVLGLLLPSIFLCLAKSLQFAGILKTEIAQRLAVILSLLAAYFIFGEQFSQCLCWNEYTGGYSRCIKWSDFIQRALKNLYLDWINQWYCFSHVIG